MKIFTLTFFIFSFQLNAAVKYHCQTNYPPMIETTIGISSEQRGSIEIDSLYLYPDTGMSWNVLLERVYRDNEEQYDYADFQANERYLYNIFVPKVILNRSLLVSLPESFPSEIHWQIEDGSQVFKNDLKCILVLPKS